MLRLMAYRRGDTLHQERAQAGPWTVDVKHHRPGHWSASVWLRGTCYERERCLKVGTEEEVRAAVAAFAAGV